MWGLGLGVSDHSGGSLALGRVGSIHMGAPAEDSELVCWLTAAVGSDSIWT